MTPIWTPSRTYEPGDRVITQMKEHWTVRLLRRLGLWRGPHKTAVFEVIGHTGEGA